jgi:crotonobetainyl-CoA:carnitine CoA-transferase CaiB-like acyl-CoA transferase
MTKALEGIKAVEIGAAVAMPISGMLMGSWGAGVFLNNLRPYEMQKFNLTYEAISARNPKIIYANLTGYGLKGPEKNAGGYDSVAFWARSGVMEMMHDPDTAPNISRGAQG